MLNIPLWNRVLIWGLVALGLAFAMPNLFYPLVERHNDAATAIAVGSTSANSAVCTTATGVTKAAFFSAGAK